jgi:arylsulfatase A-like enzyme
MGIVPPGTKLAPKPKAIKDWDTLSADEKRLFARQAEVFAAFAEYTDHEIGRMLKAFDDVGQADNTLVVYIAGDNGTSGEGGANGMFNEYTYFNGVQEKVEDMLKRRSTSGADPIPIRTWPPAGRWVSTRPSAG